MKDLYLLRGLPGAGKSTLATTIEPVFWFEADKYFEDRDGGYHFNASKLKEAHKWCQDRVEMAMSAPNGFPPSRIVVSNTFTQEWEMKPYFDLAKKYGYRVHSIVVENRHGGVNTHNVPEEVIENMSKRFQVKLT